MEDKEVSQDLTEVAGSSGSIQTVNHTDLRKTKTSKASNDKTRCSYRGILYGAKCLKKRRATGGSNTYEYYVHYTGYNKRHDEWVDENRVSAPLEITQSNESEGQRSITPEVQLSSEDANPIDRASAPLEMEIIQSNESEGQRSITPEVQLSSEDANPIDRASAPLEMEIIQSNESEGQRSITPEVQLSSEDANPIERASSPLEMELIQSNESEGQRSITPEVQLSSEDANPIKRDDKTRCSYGGILYDAKCLKKRRATGGSNTYEYYVHYTGWNKRHDEWVDENRVTQSNESEGQRSITPEVQLSSEDANPIERDSVELEIKISDRLKYFMDVRSGMITKNNKIIQFSNFNTIHKLIDEYNNSTSYSRYKSFPIGKLLIERFNTLIHKELIYEVERENQIHEKAKNVLETRIHSGEFGKYSINSASYSEILWHYVYAPAYILRLFDNLPKHLPAHWLTNELIIKNIEYFLEYVESNLEKYFPESEYIDNN